MEEQLKQLLQQAAQCSSSNSASTGEDGGTDQGCSASLSRPTLLDSQLINSSEFRMYCFKILPCIRRHGHDWQACPFAHPGEKATRRCPQKHQYVPLACPSIKQTGTCSKGVACNYAHNIFEFWCHPLRFRTQMCSYGADCKRPICFFAHSYNELRVVDQALLLELEKQMDLLGEGAAFGFPSSNSKAKPHPPSRQDSMNGTATPTTRDVGLSPAISRTSEDTNCTASPAGATLAAVVALKQQAPWLQEEPTAAAVANPALGRTASARTTDTVRTSDAADELMGSAGSDCLGAAAAAAVSSALSSLRPRGERPSSSSGGAATTPTAAAPASVPTTVATPSSGGMSPVPEGHQAHLLCSPGGDGLNNTVPLLSLPPLPVRSTRLSEASGGSSSEGATNNPIAPAPQSGSSSSSSGGAVVGAAGGAGGALPSGNSNSSGGAAAGLPVPEPSSAAALQLLKLQVAQEKQRHQTSQVLAAMERQYTPLRLHTAAQILGVDVGHLAQALATTPPPPSRTLNASQVSLLQAMVQLAASSTPNSTSPASQTPTAAAPLPSAFSPETGFGAAANWALQSGALAGLQVPRTEGLAGKTQSTAHANPAMPALARSQSGHHHNNNFMVVLDPTGTTQQQQQQQHGARSAGLSPCASGSQHFDMTPEQLAQAMKLLADMSQQQQQPRGSQAGGQQLGQPRTSQGGALHLSANNANLLQLSTNPQEGPNMHHVHHHGEGDSFLLVPDWQSASGGHTLQSQVEALQQQQQQQQLGALASVQMCAPQPLQYASLQHEPSLTLSLGDGGSVGANLQHSPSGQLVQVLDGHEWQALFSQLGGHGLGTNAGDANTQVTYQLVADPGPTASLAPPSATHMPSMTSLPQALATSLAQPNTTTNGVTLTPPRGGGRVRMPQRADSAQGGNFLAAGADISLNVSPTFGAAAGHASSNQPAGNEMNLAQGGHLVLQAQAQAQARAQANALVGLMSPKPGPQSNHNSNNMGVLVLGGGASLSASDILTLHQAQQQQAAGGTRPPPVSRSGSHNRAGMLGGLASPNPQQAGGGVEACDLASHLTTFMGEHEMPSFELGL